MNEFYVTCPRGLENILKTEIEELIDSKIVLGVGGVSFQGDMQDMYKINYLSRIGMHVLVKLFESDASNIETLYEKIYNHPWHTIIDPSQTFVVKNKSNSKVFNNPNYITLKIKDGIVDRIQKEKGSRPSINKSNPTYYIHTYIKNTKLKVFLNSSGRPLFMRGYRTKIHKAALNESLAAGILKLTSWKSDKPLYDFMCGSGTFCLEATMSAFNIPPGILRDTFSFFNWNTFDHQLWNNIKKRGKEKIKYFNLDIHGSDLVQQNIDICIDSAKKLGIDKYLNFKRIDFKAIMPKNINGNIIINPPYGYRLGDFDKLKPLYTDIGDHIKNYFSGYDAYIFTGNLQLLKSIGLRTKTKTILKNGKIDCRLAYYPLKKGKY